MMLGPGRVCTSPFGGRSPSPFRRVHAGVIVNSWLSRFLLSDEHIEHMHGRRSRSSGAVQSRSEGEYDGDEAPESAGDEEAIRTRRLGAQETRRRGQKETDLIHRHC